MRKLGTALGGRLTYANVMSTIAVFCAIGGGTFAFAALKKNSVGTKQIAKNAVKEGELAKNAVTEKKIAAGAVTDQKLGQLTVAADEILDGSIGTGKLADNAVTTAKVADNAVTGAKANESTFGQVPSAAVAEDASNVLGAVVNGNGTLAVATQPGISSAKTGVFGGSYNVEFGRDLGGCSAVASLGNNAQNVPNPGEIGTSTFPGSTSVQVQTRDSGGAATDNGFHIIVTC